MDAEVGDVVVFAKAVDDGSFRVSAHGATAHLVSGEQADPMGCHGELVDGGFGVGPVGIPVGIQVHQADFFGAGGELDFSHGVEGLPQSGPEVVGNRIVQYRAAVVTQGDGAAGAFGVEAIPEQGDDGLHVGQTGHGVDLVFAVAGDDAAGHAGVQGRHFQFVANGAVDAVSEVEFVRVDGLRRAVKGVHLLGHPGNGGVDRMDERPLADALVRVRNIGAKQQTGAADGAGGDHEMSGLEGDPDPGRGDAIGGERGGFQMVDLVLFHDQTVCAQAME